MLTPLLRGFGEAPWAPCLYTGAGPAQLCVCFWTGPASSRMGGLTHWDSNKESGGNDPSLDLRALLWGGVVT